MGEEWENNSVDHSLNQVLRLLDRWLIKKANAFIKKAEALNKKKPKKGGRVKVNEGGYIGKAIRSEYGGVKLSNPSYEKYYKGMI